MELLAGYSFIRLSPDTQIKPFDCNDSDLNDFLLNDSLNYSRNLLAVTYLLENATETVAFFSLMNDKIIQEDCTDRTTWNRIRRIFPNSKRIKSYPAVKIARLGVNVIHKNKGLGRLLLDYIKVWFVSNNKTGCRFITVDAYRQSLGFYEKNGFKYLTENDAGADTRLMYFDLSQIPIELAYEAQ